MTGELLCAVVCGCRAYCHEIGTLAACSHPTNALCKFAAGVTASKCGAGGVAESAAVWSGAGAEG